jgi:AraC-like DNA-binding protein
MVDNPSDFVRIIRLKVLLMTDRLAALMPGLTVHAVGLDQGDANLLIWDCAGGFALGPAVAMPVGVAPRLTAQVGGGVWLEHLWPDMPAVRVGPGDPVYPLVELALAELAQPRCGTATLMQGYVQAIIVHILRNAIERGAVTSGVLAGLADPRLSRVLVALHDDPAQDWNVERMAGLAGMSRSAFMARFGKVLGVPPASYLRQFRMTRARQDLSAGEKTRTVARRYGYGSTEAFTRALRGTGQAA